MRSIAEALLGSGLDALDARVLLRHALGCGEAYLLAHPDRRLAAGEWGTYTTLCARRAAGEPVAYITGEREFYSLSFTVTPAVLIPRPETETLVESALEHIPPDEPFNVLDLATGSGCVAVTIAKQRSRARITATDNSRDALAIARGNAGKHGARVEFIESDWFAALAGRRFDLIVSNPPYVAEGDPHLSQGDLRFEPRAALVAGRDGLDCIRLLAERARAHLEPRGMLLLEHGHDQAAHCRATLTQAGYRDVDSRRDLSGTERISRGRV